MIHSPADSMSSINLITLGPLTSEFDSPAILLGGGGAAPVLAVILLVVWQEVSVPSVLCD